MSATHRTEMPPTPPAGRALAGRLHANDAAREKAAAVAQRLHRRFRAETRQSHDAAAPLRDAAFHQWLGSVSGMLPGKLAWVRPELADLELVPIDEGRQRLCIALRGDEPLVGLVLADPFDGATRLWLEARLRAAGRPRTRWYVAPADELLDFYDRLTLTPPAGRPAAPPATVAPAAAAAPVEAVTRSAPPVQARTVTSTGPVRGPATHPAAPSRSAPAPAAPTTATATPPRIEVAAMAMPPPDDAPVRRFVAQVLDQALARSASDVHLSCTPDGLLVRYRIEGVLQVVNGADGRDFAARVMRRLRQLADLDALPRRGAQDGRLQWAHDDREVEARLSILPGRHGEDAVLRILDRQPLAQAGSLNVAALGFDPLVAGAMRRLASRPHGLLIVTGPPGCGKTSTLYGLLGEQPPGSDRLITIEDPVEAPLHDALQIAVDESNGLGWTHALRAALRHDADRLMLGDLRDVETARLAVQAALGGQRLYAALGANQAFEAIGRLTALGVDPYDLTAALNGVIAQRLLRRVCPHCAEAFEPPTTLLAASGLPRAVLEEGWSFRRGAGCPACRGSGYLGRQAIAQVLTLDLELKGLIAQRASPAAQREAAERQGLTTLREAALELVSSGLTTLEEANRVTAVQE